jgi:hypothetical protein
MGDAAMAAYPDAAHAVDAALDMLGAIERFNEGSTRAPGVVQGRPGTP